MGRIDRLDFISVIPYKTLEMIEIANKQRSLFFEIFKSLDTDDFQGWRIGIVVEKNLYLKSENETNIYVYPYENPLEINQYIILLKNQKNDENFKLIRKIINILDEFRISFQEINSHLMNDFFLEILYIDCVIETKNLF